MKDKYCKNGQLTHKQEGDILTYYYKDGKLKAQGKSINGLMEGE